MEPISRRRALLLGGLGVASTVIGGAGLVRTITGGFEPAAGAALVEPPMLASTGGRLQVRLEASEGLVTVAGRQATVLRYNGALPGPTLHLQPGDRLQICLLYTSPSPRDRS